MDSEQLLKCFGRPSNDADIVQFLSSLKVATPKLCKGVYNAYASSKKDGISLLFQDEAMFKKEKKSIGKSPLILIGAFYYAQGHEDFSQYAGPLPDGLTFSSTRDEITKRLGASEWKREKDGVVLRERWPRGDQRLFITFNLPKGDILVVYRGFYS